MATDKRVQATTEVRNHVAHVREALKGFSDRDVRVLDALIEDTAASIPEDRGKVSGGAVDLGEAKLKRCYANPPVSQEGGGSNVAEAKGAEGEEERCGRALAGHAGDCGREARHV